MRKTVYIHQVKEEYAELAELMDTEARSFQQLAIAHEKRLKDERTAFDARLKAMQTELENRQQLPQQLSASIQKATAQLSLNEELTRILIDQQLISAGWEADTEQLTYQKGARPEKGKNKAIAEWPTQGTQSADYVLFAGLTAGSRYFCESIFGLPCPKKRQKLRDRLCLRLPQPSCFIRRIPNKGYPTSFSQ